MRKKIVIISIFILIFSSFTVVLPIKAETVCTGNVYTDKEIYEIGEIITYGIENTCDNIISVGCLTIQRFIDGYWENVTPNVCTFLLLSPGGHWEITWDIDEQFILGSYRVKGDYVVASVECSGYAYFNNTEPLPPVADFTYQPTNPKITELIEFTDTSTDSDGSIVKWWWDFGDGYYSEVQDPYHCYCKNGIYNVSLKIVSKNGFISVKNKTIYVTSVLGDMNGDEKLNTGDVRYLAIYVASKGMHPDFRPLFANGDVNNDGLLNSGDVRYLAIYVASQGMHPDFSPLYP